MIKVTRITSADVPHTGEGSGVSVGRGFGSGVGAGFGTGHDGGAECYG